LRSRRTAWQSQRRCRNKGGEENIGSGGAEGGKEQGDRESSPSDRSVAVAGESARREEPGKKITSVR
jgi:hypothetical protein